VALARNGEPQDQAAAVDALTALDWSRLSAAERIDLLRAYGLVATRLGDIKDAQADAVAKQIGGAFPTGNNSVDRELAQMLVYLSVPEAVSQIVAEMKSSPSQENQIHYAMTLRNAKQGWNRKLYRQYFSWFRDIQSARGGMSFGGFIENIKKAALEHVDDETQAKLSAVINPPEGQPAEPEAAPRELVKNWTVDDLIGTVSDDDRKPDFQQGKEVFAAAQCYKCHRMGLQILRPLADASARRMYWFRSSSPIK
jgi:hypothetical protein